MDIYSAVQFSAKRVSAELFSAGSIFSVYSLATTFCIAVFALAWRQKARRGHVLPKVLARAILQKKILLNESFSADVKLAVLSVIFMPAVIGSIVISSNAVAMAVRSVLTHAFGAPAPLTGYDLQIRICSTVVLFLAYEIGYWVDHFLKHRVPFLWELHKVHHTADVLTPVTNFRNHPIDNVVFGYMLALFIGSAAGVLDWCFGRHAESFSVDGKNVLFIFFLWTIGHLQHSQFWIPFRGVLGNLILSPAHHQIHHSNDPQHFNRNLGSVLAIWDWMFGTLEIPAIENPRLTYGVDEEGVNPHSSFGLLATPPVKSAIALWRSVGSIGRLLAGAWTSPSLKRNDA